MRPLSLNETLVVKSTLVVRSTPIVKTTPADESTLAIKSPPPVAPLVPPPAPYRYRTQILKWLNAHARAAPASSESSPSPLRQQRAGLRGASFWSGLGIGGEKGLLGHRWGGGAFGAGAGTAAAGPGRRCSRYALERACEAGHFSTAVWLTSKRPAEVGC